MTEHKSDNWLMLNAIECWLHYFPQHQWVPQYVEMRDALKVLVAKEELFKEEEKKSPISSRQTKTKPTTTDK